MAIDQNEAVAALASMRETKARLPEGLRWGWRHHLLFGMIAGAWLMVDLLPKGLQGPGYMGCVLAYILLRKWSGDASGRRIDRFRAGRARHVAIAMAAVFLSACFLCDWLVKHGHTPLGPLYVGLAMVLVAAFADRLWMRAYYADLAEGR